MFNDLKQTKVFYYIKRCNCKYNSYKYNFIYKELNRKFLIVFVSVFFLSAALILILTQSYTCSVELTQELNDEKDKKKAKLLTIDLPSYKIENEVIAIADYINKIEYDRFVYLNTRDIFKDLVSEGQGRDFSFWEDYFQKNILTNQIKLNTI